MIGRRNLPFVIGIVLAAVLAASFLTAVFTAGIYGRSQYQAIGKVCEAMLAAEPELDQTLAAALKQVKSQASMPKEENVLSALGYRQSDFMKQAHKSALLFAAAGLGTGSVLCLLVYRSVQKRKASRLEELTSYLEQVNTGSPELLLSSREDEYSRLQDEIYKTVTMLYQTREEAIEAKASFAQNLSNIAHQLKTPVTAMSLTTQMMKSGLAGDYPEQMEKQLGRLMHLEEALLLLSRLDAGTLPLLREAVDVFTVLTLAADNLQELLLQSDVAVDIPEMGAVEITADLEWTMEAMMNLLKNCMEHTPAGGTVRCSYVQNPLYTEIIIRDSGEGFTKEDLPHLFERFYRGQNAAKGGIGIGLSLSKEIIERQNGTIRARNIPGGGGCFEIRFYSH